MKMRLPVFIQILLLCFLGVLLRIFIASKYPHVPLFDETEYLYFAENIRSKIWWANCCSRTYGYPLTLTVIRWIFGQTNFQAISIIQAIVDSATAGFLFYVSKTIFKNIRYAWVTFFVYLINPLTASYTGMILTEIQALFLLVVVTYFLVQIFHRWQYSFLFGFSLGMLTFTRIIFWWWSLVILLFLCLFSFRRRNVFKGFILLGGFSITLIYPIVANIKTFHSFSAVPVFPSFQYNLILGQKYSYWPALLSEFNQQELNEITRFTDYVYNYYHYDRNDFIQKVKPFYKQTVDEIMRQPFVYLTSRIRNIPLWWNKSNLYYYWDPFYPMDKPYLRIGNALFLTVVGLGIIRSILKRKKSFQEKILLTFTLFTIVYFIVPMSLIMPEERHTLSLYSLLCLYIPLGLSGLLSMVISLLRMKRRKGSTLFHLV
jgi:hypothetical protein